MLELLLLRGYVWQKYSNTGVHFQEKNIIVGNEIWNHFWLRKPLNCKLLSRFLGNHKLTVFLYVYMANRYGSKHQKFFIVGYIGLDRSGISYLVLCYTSVTDRAAVLAGLQLTLQLCCHLSAGRRKGPTRLPGKTTSRDAFKPSLDAERWLLSSSGVSLSLSLFFLPIFLLSW